MGFTPVNFLNDGEESNTKRTRTPKTHKPDLNVSECAVGDVVVDREQKTKGTARRPS